MSNIAIFMGGLQLDSQRKVLEGIISEAAKNNDNLYLYALTLVLDENFNMGECAVVLNDNLSLYDGFIVYSESIYSTEVRSKLVSKLMPLGKPCASIDWEMPGAINVSSNNDDAMRRLSRHLIDKHNIKTVNFIGGPEDSLDAITRRDAFADEMKKSGRTFDYSRYFVGDYYARSGRKAVDYFEEKGLINADAYVCANDQMALGAFYALAERGIEVPRDVLMSGYDDIFEAANHYPRITSVKRYEEEIGKTAYSNLVKCINGEEYDTHPEIQSSVVCAESCGCDTGRPISHRVVVNGYVEKSLRETRYAEMISDFSADVTGIIDYSHLAQRLEQYIPGLGGDAFATCLFEKENDYEHVKMEMGYRNGGFYSYENRQADRKIDYFNDGTGGNIYVINSIHFGSRCYGYTIIRNSKMPMQSEFYRIFAINLGSTIEHINNYSQMQGMIKKLDEMWVFDPMTHVYNRAGFFKFADEMHSNAKTNKENLFLIFLDLDGLKKVNDELGHEMGDRLICEMADILRKCRDKEELLMRYGGDEFVIFGEGYVEENIAEYIRRIRKAMAEVNDKNDRPYLIDASIGYSIVRYDDDRSLSSQIEIADQKMYAEKREKHKKNRG